MIELSSRWVFGTEVERKECVDVEGVEVCFVEGKNTKGIPTGMPRTTGGELNSICSICSS